MTDLHRQVNVAECIPRIVIQLQNSGTNFVAKSKRALDTQAFRSLKYFRTSGELYLAGSAVVEQLDTIIWTLRNLWKCLCSRK